MKITSLTQKNYKTTDQSNAIKEAQLLIDQIKRKQNVLRSIRIDESTIVQIGINRSNSDQIIERVKSKIRKITIVDQLEYGHYA